MEKIKILLTLPILIAVFYLYNLYLIYIDNESNFTHSHPLPGWDCSSSILSLNSFVHPCFLAPCKWLFL